MKAVVLRRPGKADVLEYVELEKPVPRNDEVLIRIRATTVTRGDVALRRIPTVMWPLLRLGMGLQRKRILGHEFAGEVEALGRGVRTFLPGEAVFGTTTGLAVGANAEFVCVTNDVPLAAKPAAVTFEEAAAVPVGGMTALWLLRKAGLRPEMRVLIYGASGSVGSFAVQLAAHAGAEVTGVCSAVNVDLVRSLGAAKVIDYTRDDYAASGQRYDVIFDAVGKTSRSHAARALRPGATFVSVRTAARERRDDLVVLRDLLERGAIRPVIDRRFGFEQIREAHRYVEAGHKKGNVVITVSA